jgi:ribonuclease P/MRP protein subunit POP1
LLEASRCRGFCLCKTLTIRYEPGARSSHVTLYHDQTFPYGLIGPAEVIWRPEEDHLDERTIWIRTHPSVHAEILEVLENLVASSQFRSDEASTSTSHVPAVKISDLRNQVDSFEIMGPKSARILRRILRLSKTEGKDKAKVSYQHLILYFADCPVL